jgi:hypothetical protein
MMAMEWRIDALGEDSAAVEEDGKLVHVPRWLLPAAARENDILRIQVDAQEAEVIVTLRLDAGATDAAMEASRRQVRSTPPQKDPGGPIQL